ncbi:Lacal_2735 family protein [Alienimonas sp. DA493]|uniref:Lacal_2735 family protein n=1 Tax=Alienimonas sp. DA493 TaxID=3373605 RepID=UPI0037542F4C
MFGLFKKKDPLEALKAKHAKTLERAAEVSRNQGVVAASAVHAEAAEIEQEIDRLEAERRRD